MNVKSILAKEWLIAIICIPLGIVIASIFSASTQPHDLGAGFAYNIGWSMGGLFTIRQHAANWGIVFIPYFLLQIVRLTMLAIDESKSR